MSLSNNAYNNDQYVMRWLKGIVLVLLGALLVWQPLSATAQEPPNRADTDAFISSPSADSVISGSVSIRGTASHPTAFDRYELEYANQGNPTPFWLPIGEAVGQAAIDEELAIWDTVALGIADGVYQIRLTVYLTDENIAPVTIVISNLQLINTAPTPLPTIPAADNPNLTDATIAPPIEQPPTSTPRPTTESLAVDTTGLSSASSSTSNGGSSLNVGRLQSAFCSGAIVSLILFGLLIGYLSVRARLRPVTRQIMWQIRNEMDDEK